MKGKKLLSVLLAFVLVLSLFPVLTASAADYDILICGKKVTDANKGDVLGDGAVSFVPTGSVYYLYLSKSVSWNNGAAMAAISSTLGAELRIVVTGDVTVERTMNGGAIRHNGQLSITCDGAASKLTVIGTGSNSDGAIYAEGGIDIADALVDAGGGPYGIHAGGKLGIDRSTVSAKGTTSAIYAEGGLSLGSEMGVATPATGKIFGSDIRDAEGNRATEVLLQPIDTYNLEICGTQVTSANCKDILGDGVFAYDPNTTTLTVSGDCEYMGTMIKSGITGTVIRVEKDSTLKIIDGHGILAIAPARIEGPGKLTITGALSCIFVSGCAFSIKDANLDLNGKNGICGEKEAKLYLYDSAVSIKASAAAISGFDPIQLNGCSIEAPENAEIKDGGVKVGEEFAKTVEIRPKVEMLGDVDGSGEVDTIDSIRLAKYLVELVELTEEQKQAADINGDGDVTTLDAIRLAKYLVGLVETLKPEST